MSQVLQLKEYSPKTNNMIVDANIMIQYADSSHSYHKPVFNAIRGLIKNDVKLFYPDFCLREFREYFRRVFLKEYLIGYTQSHSLGLQVDHLINQLELSIRDKDFKAIRDKLENVNPGLGFQTWFALCNNALANRMKVIEQFIKTSKFVILKLGPNNIFPQTASHHWPNEITESNYTLNFGLGSVDSALVDWYSRGTCLDGLITNDHDLLIAQLCGAVPSGVFYTTIPTY